MGCELRDRRHALRRMRERDLGSYQAGGKSPQLVLRKARHPPPNNCGARPMALWPAEPAIGFSTALVRPRPVRPGRSDRASEDAGNMVDDESESHSIMGFWNLFMSHSGVGPTFRRPRRSRRA